MQKQTHTEGAAATQAAQANPICRVVGLGASAGGLAALSEFLQALPDEPGLAFVLVQHLSPEHKSELARLLKHHTSMPVDTITDGMQPQANCVYVIPPGQQLSLRAGCLRLSTSERGAGAELGIDHFFHSLAEEQGRAAIGVVLSGTGSDGALGLRAIKEAGGLTFAQDEASAKFAGMPRHAMASGCADLVLPPAEIAKEIVRVAAHSLVLSEDAPAAMKTLLTLLEQRSGVEFGHYKHNMIRRRIERRILLLRLDSIEAYAAYAAAHPEEVTALQHDLLINVTRFFRDTEAYAALRSLAIPELFTGRIPGTTLRVWVPGCSTGEEAYSLAIVLIEYMEAVGLNFPLQIFGSDIDEDAIRCARSGIFSRAIQADVSDERLNRFFVRIEEGYQIRKDIRDRCIFSRQNMVKDPPFSNLDMISCRNVLIYLDTHLQERALGIFHYALKPGGVLFLGSAESIGGQADAFTLIDQKARLYTHSLAGGVPRPAWRGMTGGDARGAPLPLLEPMGGQQIEFEREVERLLLKLYAPPAVVVNEHMQVLYFHGDTARFLGVAAGRASLNVLKMARGNLLVELKIALQQAQAEQIVVRRKQVPFRIDGQRSFIHIEVHPLKQRGAFAGTYLVLFEEAATVAAPDTGLLPDELGQVAELTHELTATKEYLQSAIAQHDAVSAELHAAGEELQSSNEELQSMNEELESAKEELQSSNEELATVNDELERRNVELMQLNSDLSNLVEGAGLHMFTVTLDRDLRIRRFSARTEPLLNLIPGDIGRPFLNIKINMASVDFGHVLQEVLASGSARQLEARDDQGRWYGLRFVPVNPSVGQEGGLTIVFVNIDQAKRDAAHLADERAFAAALMDAVPRPALLLDNDLRVLSASAAYLRYFEVSAKDTVGNLLYYLGNGPWANPHLRAALERVFDGHGPLDAFPVEHDFAGIGPRRVMVSARLIAAGQARPAQLFMQVES